MPDNFRWSHELYREQSEYSNESLREGYVSLKNMERSIQEMTNKFKKTTDNFMREMF